MKINLIILAVLVALGGVFLVFFRTTPPAVAPGGTAQETKINIDYVCNSALAYMTFNDDAAAQAFVSECKEGKHPEVIERYKAELSLGAGAQI